MAQEPPTTQNTQSRMYNTKNAVESDARRSLVILLNQRLADATDVYAQTKHAHWNVKGLDFYQLHLLFDQLAETVEGHVDLIAERTTALGGRANGTLRMAAQATSMPEIPNAAETGPQLLEALTDTYSRHSRKCAEAIETCDEAGDKATADLFTQVVRDLDKALYFLESHLQGSSSGRA